MQAMFFVQSEVRIHLISPCTEFQLHQQIEKLRLTPSRYIVPFWQVHIPPSAMLDGVHSQHFFGTGLIVHHSQDLGLVVVDKNTVAISVSDVMLAFAAYPMEIPAEVCFFSILKFIGNSGGPYQLNRFSTFTSIFLNPFDVALLQVVFLHPVHNFAIVAYDPSALGPAGAAAVKAAVLLPGKSWLSESIPEVPMAVPH